MLSISNPTVTFGKTPSKTQNNSFSELNKKITNNNMSKYGAAATVLLGYTVGHTAINQFAKGKSYNWNTTLNNSAKKIAEQIPEKFGLKYAKEAITKIAKTSGRQKMQGALAIAAGVALLSVVSHYAHKNGELKNELKNQNK